MWVDLLTRREFEQGFGSHTPMFTGQTKCVRYYMNFERALALQKKVQRQECGRYLGREGEKEGGRGGRNGGAQYMS